MNDADGIDAVCMADYYQNGNVIYSIQASEVIDLDDSVSGQIHGYYLVLSVERFQLSYLAKTGVVIV